MGAKRAVLAVNYDPVGIRTKVSSRQLSIMKVASVSYTHITAQQDVILAPKLIYLESINRASALSGSRTPYGHLPTSQDNYQDTT